MEKSKLRLFLLHIPHFLKKGNVSLENKMLTQQKKSCTTCVALGVYRADGRTALIPKGWVQITASSGGLVEASRVAVSLCNLSLLVIRESLKSSGAQKQPVNEKGKDKQQIRSHNQGFFMVCIFKNKWLLLLRVNSNISSSKTAG